MEAKVLCSSKLAPQRTSFPPVNVYDSIEFDPKIGFIIHNVGNIADLDCFGRNGSTNSLPITYIISMKRMLIKPFLYIYIYIRPFIVTQNNIV